MKATKHQESAMSFAPAPVGEVSRGDKKAKSAADHGSDPTHRFHLKGLGADLRRTVAASGALQRRRARQTEGM